MRLLKFHKLRKEPGLSDVFVISTGAMVTALPRNERTTAVCEDPVNSNRPVSAVLLETARRAYPSVRCQPPAPVLPA